MTEYIITRTRDRSQWAMTESAGDQHHEIYRSADNRSMRVVAIFDAPSWEDAKSILDCICWKVPAQPCSKGKLSWEEAQALVADGERRESARG